MGSGVVLRGMIISSLFERIKKKKVRNQWTDSQKLRKIKRKKKKKHEELGQTRDVKDCGSKLCDQ